MKTAADLSKLTNAQLDEVYKLNIGYKPIEDDGVTREEVIKVLVDYQENAGPLKMDYAQSWITPKPVEKPQGFSIKIETAKLEIKIETHTDGIPFKLIELATTIDEYPAHHVEVMLESDINVKQVFVGYIQKDRPNKF